MRIYDTLYFKNGNPKPKGGVEFQVNQAKKMYSELSPETKEFFANPKSDRTKLFLSQIL